jgi:hypothetical protein
MKERVKNVLNFKKRSRIIVTIAVVAAVTLSIGLTMNRVAAESEYENGTIGYDEPYDYDELQQRYDAMQQRVDSYREILRLIIEDDEIDIIGESIEIDDDIEDGLPSHQPDSQQVIHSVPNTEHHDTRTAEQQVFGAIAELLGDASMTGSHWSLALVTRNAWSPTTNAPHLNNFAANIIVPQHGVWSEAEEAALLRLTQRIFEQFSELRGITYFIDAIDIDGSRFMHRTAQLTASRVAINGVGQWCIENRHTEILPDGGQICCHGDIIFQWMPEGHDYESIYAVLEALPLPDPDWRFVGVGMRTSNINSFLEHGDYFNAVTIKYIVPDDFWLTDAAEGIITRNAAQLFEHFEDLQIVTNQIETIHGDQGFTNVQWVEVFRNDTIN